MVAFRNHTESRGTVKPANAFTPGRATAELIIRFEQLEDAVVTCGSSIAATSFRCRWPQALSGDGLYRPG